MKRSRLRIYILLLFVADLLLVRVMGDAFPSWVRYSAFAIFFVLSFSILLVRCEQCSNNILSRSNQMMLEGRLLARSVVLFTFLFPKKCPVCGLERV